MKKHLSVKLAALILALIMTAAIFVSCADKTPEPGPSDGTTAPVTQGQQGEEATTTPETEAPKNEYGITIIPDDLPEKLDLQKREFVVHTRGNVDQYEWTAEEENGETLNDAIYRRNTRVEDRYNIDIVVKAEGTWQDYNDNLKKVRASIETNNAAYDLLAGYSTPASSLATTGHILNLNNLEYINFSKPWWSDDFKDTFTIGDKTYFGIGSLSVAMIYSMECIFVNTAILKEVDENYNIYKTVDNREWTWDEMVRVGALAYDDENGNQIPDAGDRFGFACCEHNNNPIFGFFLSTGTKTVVKGEDGLPVLNEDFTKMADVADKLIRMLYTTNTNYAYDNGTALKFEDGKVLFYMHWLYYGQTKYAKVMDDYGIVPMPLFNEDQKEYCTPIQSGMHMYAIPRDVTDPNEDAMIVEALASESYHSLMPAYYEVVLKTRFVKDADTSRMIDIMYNTTTFDLGQSFNSSIKYIDSFSTMVTTKRPAPVTMSNAYKTCKKNLESLITKIMENQS